MRSMRDEWEMTFVDSGAAALKFMEYNNVHVVISDMRMPGMNGAELLGTVMQFYPHTIRLVLSGHSDQDLILKCVGSTHQYLSKPCDPETLRKTIARALALESNLKSQRIQTLITRMECLPSVPKLYTEIMEKMNDPEVIIEDVGKIVARDIGMTTQMLKMVNSAYFGLRREISNPAEAVAYLGLDTIKSLILGIHTFSEFESPATRGFSMSALWNHSLGVAIFAKLLTQQLTRNFKMMDEAFVAGLLHDAGKAALAYNFPDQYREISQQTQGNTFALLSAETQAFSVNHADVGGYLLGLWGLPTPVVEAIGLHHHPSLSLNEEFTPLTAVHVANALTHAEATTTPVVDVDYLKHIHCADDIEIWQRDFNEHSAALKQQSL